MTRDGGRRAGRATAATPSDPRVAAPRPARRGLARAARCVAVPRSCSCVYAALSLVLERPARHARHRHRRQARDAARDGASGAPRSRRRVLGRRRTRRARCTRCTTRTAIGDKWVHVTTLPMLVRRVPAVRVGGDRAVLAAPDARRGARARSRHVRSARGSVRRRRVARVLGRSVSLTPVAIYALDFWEHTLGLALMVVGDRAAARRARAARRLAGRARRGLRCSALAATMRTEALVYLVVATRVVVPGRARRAATPLARPSSRPASVRGRGSLAVARRERVLERADVGGPRARGSRGAARSRAR